MPEGLHVIDRLQDDLAADLLMTEAAVAASTPAADIYGTDAAQLHVARVIEDQCGLSFVLLETGPPLARSPTRAGRIRRRPDMPEGIDPKITPASAS